MFILWIAVTDYFGWRDWVSVIPPLVHLTVVSLLMIMAAAVDTGRYELAKVLALVTAIVDIFTIIPVVLRLIFLSMISRWLGEVEGLAAPVIIFILVYFIEDLRQAGRPRTVISSSIHTVVYYELVGGCPRETEEGGHGWRGSEVGKGYHRVC